MSDEPVILETFGDPDAAVCVDGVCAVPAPVADGSVDPQESADVETETVESTDVTEPGAPR